MEGDDISKAVGPADGHVYSSPDGYVRTADGGIAAYVAGFRGGKAWFVMEGLPDRVARAVSSAVFSLNGLPSGADLAREINRLLAASRVEVE